MTSISSQVDLAPVYGYACASDRPSWPLLVNQIFLFHVLLFHISIELARLSVFALSYIL
jgi:hypothetical protein